MPRLLAHDDENRLIAITNGPNIGEPPPQPESAAGVSGILSPTPTGGYGYNVTSNLFFRGATALTFPTNTYEIFAFCDESRSRALGRQPNVGGAFTVAAQIELNAAPYAFGTPHKGHSAQFRSYNAARWVYWDQLLSTFNIPR